MWTAGLQNESSPPLYYMAVGAWIHVFGSSEAALRSLSAVCSSLSILLVYALGKKLLGRGPGLVAAALFAASATQVYYAQEARPYALLLLPVVAVLIACVDYLRSSGRPLALLLYIVAATTSIYTHATMTLFVAACGSTVLVAACRAERHAAQPAVLRWIAANLCVTLFALPGLIGMLEHAEGGKLGWISPLNWHDIGAMVSNTVVGTLTPGHFPGGVLAIVMVCVLALAVWRRALPRHMGTIVLEIPGLYAALVILVSVSLQPIALSRIFCWVGVPLCLLQAHALAARGWLRPIAAVTIVGTACVALFYQLDTSPDVKEPWRQVLDSVEPELRQADLVVLGPDTDPAAVMYYAPALPHIAMWTSEPMSPAELGIMPRVFGIRGIVLAEILHRIDEGAPVVMIARATDEDALRQLLARVAPPTSREDRQCVGGDGKPTKYPCGIAVLAWEPEKSTADRAPKPAPPVANAEAGSQLAVGMNKRAIPVAFGTDWPDDGF